MAAKNNAKPDPNSSGGGFRNSEGEWVYAVDSPSYRAHRECEKLEEAARERRRMVAEESSDGE